MGVLVHVNCCVKLFYNLLYREDKMGVTTSFTCCSKEKEKDEDKEDIKPNNSPITYTYPTPYTVQTVQQPLYHESMSQMPMYVSASRAQTVVNQ